MEGGGAGVLGVLGPLESPPPRGGGLFGKYALEKKERTTQVGGPLDCGTTAVAAPRFQAKGGLPCLRNRPRGPPMPQSQGED